MSHAATSMALSLSGIWRRYPMGERPVPALCGVDVHIARGEQVAVVGPSGCGKSTLMNIMGLLDQPDEGQYLLFGQDTAGLTLQDKACLRALHIGFVFQQFHLLETYTAEQNVELPMLYAGLSAAERRQRVADSLAAVGLAHRAGHRPGQLSGGERQRVAIARALANAPRLLLADEPTGALDSHTGLAVLDLLQGICHDKQMTLVMVTHDIEVAARMQRRIPLRDGLVQEPVCA